MFFFKVITVQKNYPGTVLSLLRRRVYTPF